MKQSKGLNGDLKPDHDKKHKQDHDEPNQVTILTRWSSKTN